MPAQLAHAERWREEGLAYTEVEFEWIRQFYFQGKTHYFLHKWWHGPMAAAVGWWAAFTTHFGYASYMEKRYVCVSISGQNVSTDQ